MSFVLNDTIFSSGVKVFIDGVFGDNVVSLGGNSSDVTISAGKGNDTIYNASNSSGNVFIFDEISSTGNDVIYRFTSEDTIILSSSDRYRTITVDNDLVVSLYGSSIILKDGASIGANVCGIFENDFTNGESLVNYANYVTINGKATDDYIENHGETKTEIEEWYDSEGYYHFQHVTVYSGRNVLINGGSGHDSILNTENSTMVDSFKTTLYTDSHSTLNGGAGNDSIYNAGYYVTINGDAGHDYIAN